MPPIDTERNTSARAIPRARRRAKPKPYTLPKTFKPANSQENTKRPIAGPQKPAPKPLPGSIYVKPKLGPPVPPKPHKLPKSFKPASTNRRDRLTPRQEYKNDTKLVAAWERTERRARQQAMR